MLKKESTILFFLAFLLIFNSSSLFASSLDELSKAVLKNNYAEVNKIIESGVDINQKDSQGNYPLEKVLIMDNCDMAKIFLKAGADPFVLTSEGSSIYDVVMEKGTKYMKEIFKEYTV